MSIGDHVAPPPLPSAFPAPRETFFAPPVVGAAAAASALVLALVPALVQALSAVRSVTRFSSLVGGLGVEGATSPSSDAVTESSPSPRMRSPAYKGEHGTEIVLDTPTWYTVRTGTLTAWLLLHMNSGHHRC